MTTLLFTHSICLEHDTGFGPPECPARLTAVLNTLRTSPFAALEWRDAPAATLEQLTRIHPQDHIEHLLAQVPRQGQYALCLLYTSPSPRDATLSRMPSSA